MAKTRFQATVYKGEWPNDKLRVPAVIDLRGIVKARNVSVRLDEHLVGHCDAIAAHDGELVASGIIHSTAAAREVTESHRNGYPWQTRLRIRVDEPERVPTAMSEDQLRALFESAGEEPGRIAGIRARDWWTAFLAFVWSTAERKGAALAVKWSHIDFERKVVVIPAKERKGCRKTLIAPLWPEVEALLNRIRLPERELVFPWGKSEASYYYVYKRIQERAGLPPGRDFKTHCLRRSHATFLKILGGDPTASLLHGSSETTAKHYIDPRMLPQPERKLFVPWQPGVEQVDHDTAAMVWL